MPTAEIAGAEPGDQRLRKPFRVEDLERRIVTVLGSPARGDRGERRGAAAARPHRSVDPTKPSAGHRPLLALRGKLDQISYPSVLVVLEMERKNGILLIEHRRGVRAAVPAQGADHPRRPTEPPAVGRRGGLRDAQLDRRRVRLPGRRRRRRRRDPGVDDLPADRGRAPHRRSEGARRSARAEPQENKL